MSPGEKLTFAIATLASVALVYLVFNKDWRV